MSFKSNQSGSVALAFGLALGTVTVMAGIAIDYGNASGDRTKLQAAVDSAALGAARLTGLGKGDIEVRQTTAAYFASVLDGKLARASMTAERLPSGAWRVAASYEGSTLFGALTGRRTLTVSVLGEATPAGSGQRYVDIYVLVDVSQSMGIGADAADQARLYSLTGCEFACHLTNDGVNFARSNGVKLRIDAAKAALRSIASQAKVLAGSGTTVRFSIMEFANDIVRELPVTANFGDESSTGAGTIFGAINTMDVARYHPGSSIPYALKTAGQKIPSSGNGRSQASPEVVAFLISDGMGNPTRVYPDGGWGVDQNWAGFAPERYLANDWSGGFSPAINAGIACPNYELLLDQWQNTSPDAYFVNLPSGCVAEPHWPGRASHPVGLAGLPSHDTMMLQEVKPSWCDDVKRKAQLYTLYTTYMLRGGAHTPYTNHAKYAVAPRIAAGMRGCASSPASAFEAQDSAALDRAVATIFANVVGAQTPRLVR